MSPPASVDRSRESPGRLPPLADCARLGIFGRGRLGVAVACSAAGSVAWQVGRGERPPAPALAIRENVADVVVDASVAEAVEDHLLWALDAETDLVIATTGWTLENLAGLVSDQIGVVVAPNGSLAIALLDRFARILGAFAAGRPEADLFVVEHHHSRKADSPSGTARRLAASLQSGVDESRSSASHRQPAVSVASVRAGYEVGFHRVGLDTPGDLLEIHHRARSRTTFADGLLHASAWIRGRKGVFTMDDVAAEALDPLFDRTVRPQG